MGDTGSTSSISGTNQIGSLQSFEIPETEREMTPEAFAIATETEYERLEEAKKPEGIVEKVQHFVANGTNRLIKEYSEGSWMKKAAIFAGVGIAAYATGRILYKAASIFTNSIKSIFNKGQQIQEETTKLHNSTLGKMCETILKAVLGGTLAMAVIGSIVTIVEGKLELGELLDAWNQKGIKGVGELLLTKQKEGVIDLGKKITDKIAEAAGLPKIDEARQQVSQTINEVKQEVTKNMNWLDEKIHFNEGVAKLKEGLISHGIPIDDWLEKISLASIASDLGISPENARSWEEYAVAGGGLYLLYRWITFKKIAANAAVYLLLINEGKDSYAGKIIEGITGEVDVAKNFMIAELKDIPGIEYLIPEAFENFSLEERSEELLEWAKENPIEAMAGLNGLWIARSQIWKLLKNHPLILSVAAGTLYAGRREFIEKLVHVMYKENPTGEAALAMRDRLDTLCHVDRSKPESLAERQVPAYLESIFEEPLKILQSPKATEAYRRGEYSIGWDIFGRCLLFIKSVSIPLQLSKLSWESFSTSLAQIYSPENDESRVTPAIIGGLEVYLFSTAAWHGSKAYVTAITSGDSLGKMFWRSLKVMTPMTREWRFVVKSACVGPFVPILKRTRSGQVGQMQGTVKSIKAELASLENAALTPEAKKALLDKIHYSTMKMTQKAMADDIGEIKRKLSGTDFSYRYAERVDRITKYFEEISMKATSRSNPAMTKTEIEEILKFLEKDLAAYESELSGVLSRFELIKRGEFREAFRLFGTRDLTHAATPLQAKNVFEGKTDAELMTRATQLESEITALGRGDPSTAGKAKELNAIKAYREKAVRDTFTLDVSRLTSLDNSAKAKQIEILAAEMEGIERGVQSRFLVEVERITTFAKSSGLPLHSTTIQDELLKIDKELMQPFATRKMAYITELQNQYRSLPKGLQTRAMRSQIKLAIQGAEGTFLTKVTTAVKGRAKFAVIMASALFAAEKIFDEKDDDFVSIMREITSDGPQMVQLLWDVMPLTGTGSLLYSAATGQELITGESIGAGHRAINLLFTVPSLVGDMFLVADMISPAAATSPALATGVMAARLGVKAKKGSKIAEKLLEMWPRLEKVIEKVGGIQEFGKRASAYLKSGGRVASGLRAVERAGTVGGVILIGASAGHAIYSFAKGDMPEIDPEIQNLDEPETDTIELPKAA
ncbi:hypothetical protein HYV57_00550 [Candidatus Peregrinibacteria bacterium]|nr:hypothetical protein [Candidatus Peregrinibacteria bacterium]